MEYSVSHPFFIIEFGVIVEMCQAEAVGLGFIVWLYLEFIVLLSA